METFLKILFVLAALTAAYFRGQYWSRSQYRILTRPVPEHVAHDREVLLQIRSLTNRTSQALHGSSDLGFVRDAVESNLEMLRLLEPRLLRMRAVHSELSAFVATARTTLPVADRVSTLTEAKEAHIILAQCNKRLQRAIDQALAKGDAHTRTD